MSGNLPQGFSVSAVSADPDVPASVVDAGSISISLIPGEGVTFTVSLADGGDTIDCNTVTVIPECGRSNYFESTRFSFPHACQSYSTSLMWWVVLTTANTKGHALAAVESWTICLLCLTLVLFADPALDLDDDKVTLGVRCSYSSISAFVRHGVSSDVFLVFRRYR